MIITSGNISLRSIRKNDLELVRKWRNDKNVNRFMDYRKLIDPDSQLIWFNNLDPGKDFYFLICDKEKPVGVLNLKNINWVERTAEAGIFIGDASSQNTTIPVKATVLLMKTAFAWLRLKQLYAKVSIENTVAIKMNEALGYSYIKELTRPFQQFLCTDDAFYGSPVYKTIGQASIQLSASEKWMLGTVSRHPDFLVE